MTPILSFQLRWRGLQPAEPALMPALERRGKASGSAEMSLGAAGKVPRHIGICHSILRAY